MKHLKMKRRECDHLLFFLPARAAAVFVFWALLLRLYASNNFLSISDKGIHKTKYILTSHRCVGGEGRYYDRNTCHFTNICYNGSFFQYLTHPEDAGMVLLGSKVNKSIELVGLNLEQVKVAEDGKFLPFERNLLPLRVVILISGLESSTRNTLAS
jgi:hypothetical protein